MNIIIIDIIHFYFSFSDLKFLSNNFLHNVIKNKYGYHAELDFIILIHVNLKLYFTDP